MNQDDRRRFLITRFLIVNAHTVDSREPRVFGIEDELQTVTPINVARPGEQFRRHGAGDNAG